MYCDVVYHDIVLSYIPDYTVVQVVRMTFCLTRRRNRNKIENGRLDDPQCISSVPRCWHTLNSQGYQTAHTSHCFPSAPAVYLSCRHGCQRDGSWHGQRRLPSKNGPSDASKRSGKNVGRQSSRHQASEFKQDEWPKITFTTTGLTSSGCWDQPKYLTGIWTPVSMLEWTFLAL